MFIEDLFPDQKLMFEGDSIEYMQKLEHEKPSIWLKTIAGFANASGGDLYLGVSHSDRKMIGYEKNAVDSEWNYLISQINRQITPNPKVSLDFIPYQFHNKERYIIKAHVHESPVKPVILEIEGFPAIFMRRDGCTTGATYEEIHRMCLESSKKQYDVLISDLPYKSSDFSKLVFCCVHIQPYFL